MIRLRDLLKENEETFTAINKQTGNVAVFKSKEARDGAIKAGTHTTLDKKEPETNTEPSPSSSSTLGAAAARAAGTTQSQPEKKKGIFQKLAKAFGLTARPAKPEELKKAEPYRIVSGNYLAKVQYLGRVGSGHKFKVIDMYKDLKPISGRAPQNGDIVTFKADEIEKNVVVDD